MSVLEQTLPTQEYVLAKAVLNAAEQLGLKQAELAATLGISHLKQSLNPASKQGEIALLVIRIARALSALTGDDKEWVQHFMHTHNKITGDIPAEQIKSIQGLMTVVQFVEANKTNRHATA